jgi:hypothetical protein
MHSSATIENGLKSPLDQYGYSASDEIYRDARVYTKQYGSMDIQLEDGTNLVISPNSSLVIDEYVYAGAGSAGSLAISLTRGAMRMVSGKMEK